VPRFDPPSKSVTVPVGVPAVEVTLAVNVTGLQYTEGFGSEERLMLVLAGFTVCVTGGAEVLAAKLVLPV
jgi:hypothetical protein